jgi:hypothetical protein
VAEQWRAVASSAAPAEPLRNGKGRVEWSRMEGGSGLGRGHAGATRRPSARRRWHMASTRRRPSAAVEQERAGARARRGARG